MLDKDKFSPITHYLVITKQVFSGRQVYKQVMIFFKKTRLPIIFFIFYDK